MKLKNIIILTILATATIFACDDTVYPDPTKEPVKMAAKNGNERYEMYVAPDGTIISKGSCYNNESWQWGVFRKFERNGSITAFDTICDIKEPGFRYANGCVRFNVVGEMLDANLIRDSETYDLLCCAIHKFDSNGKVVESYYEDDVQPELVTLLDNGQIVYFTRNIDEETWDQSLVMHTIGSDFSYMMESNFECDVDENFTGLVSFEDKIVLYNKLNGRYCIARTDGSLVFEDCVDIHLAFIEYIDGYLYMLSYTEAEEYDESFDYYDDYYIPHQWHITKMDSLGNQIFDKTINTCDLHDKLTVHGDSLIIIGAEVADYSTLEGYAQIHILDNNSGNHIETISVDYDNCTVSPIYVSPDSKGEYDVYILRLDRFQDAFFDKMVTELNAGDVFVYHTDDLRKLQVKNN